MLKTLLTAVLTALGVQAHAGLYYDLKNNTSSATLRVGVSGTTPNDAMFVSSGAAIVQSTTSASGHKVFKVKNQAGSEILSVTQGGVISGNGSGLTGTGETNTYMSSKTFTDDVFIAGSLGVGVAAPDSGFKASSTTFTVDGTSAKIRIESASIAAANASNGQLNLVTTNSGSANVGPMIHFGGRNHALSVGLGNISIRSDDTGSYGAYASIYTEDADSGVREKLRLAELGSVITTTFSVTGNAFSVAITSFSVNAGIVSASSQPGARAEISSNVTIKAGAWQRMFWSQSSRNTNSVWYVSPSSDIFTAKGAGVYEMCAMIKIPNNGAATGAGLRFQFGKNGTPGVTQGHAANISTAVWPWIGSVTNTYYHCAKANLAANDFVILEVFNDSGTAFTPDASADGTWMDVQKIW